MQYRPTAYCNEFGVNQTDFNRNFGIYARTRAPDGQKSHFRLLFAPGRSAHGQPMSAEQIRIASRFRGPPRSGNGGYVCGRFAELLTHGDHALEGRKAAEVTLRSPVPLDTDMDILRQNGALTVHHGATLIAEVQCVDLVLDVPDAPSYASALAEQEHSMSLIVNASRRFPHSIGVHPLCFCCGTQHGDGLEVYAAPVGGNDIVAAAWPTKREWADALGNVPACFVWAALDCPGQFAYHAVGIRTGMLGRLCARIEQPISAGERCVVTGWRIQVDGRKHFAGTALFDAAGQLCAYAEAIWVGRRDS